MAISSLDVRARGDDATAPYRSSWIDGLLGAIERLPFSPWWSYAALGGLAILYLHATYWIAGTLPSGEFDRDQVVPAFYMVFPLALLHALRRTAAGVWRDFRPALDTPDSDAAVLGYELTHAPWRAGLAIAGLGASLVLLAVASGGPIGQGLVGLPLAMNVIGQWVATTTVLMLVYDVTRMLRLASRSLARVGHVNLFVPQPLYAFSRLTLRAALGLITIATVQLLGARAELNEQAASITWVAMLLVAASAAFVLPLLGIHERIATEKRALEAVAGDRLATAIARLHGPGDGAEVAAGEALDKRLASLVQARDVIARLPTWPWQAGTLRTFASAIVLPVAIWLVTHYLGKLI